MKVIKPGSQLSWSIEATCTGAGNGRPGCGALLLVEEGDLFRTESNALHETTTYITFRCPCGRATDLPRSSVPLWVAVRDSE